MLKYLDTAPAPKPTIGASENSSAAAVPPNSRLNQLLDKPPAKPADGLDIDLLSGLSLPSRGAVDKEGLKGGGHRSKRPRPAGMSCDALCVDSLDISVSPPAAAPPASARGTSSGMSHGLGRGLDGDFSIGSAGVLGGFRGRDSTGSNASSSSSGGSLKSRSVSNSSTKIGSGSNGKAGGGVGGTTSSAKNGRLKSSAVTPNTNNGSRAKRRIAEIGGSSSGTSSSHGGSSTKGKMGPWMSRPGETAICAEEGYDPLDLLHDANRELFGNDNFRGVQEDVRFSRMRGF